MEPLWTITLFAELTICSGSGDSVRDRAAGAVRRHFRSQKVASLLAYLAFHRGRAVSRELLCDLLWPDEPDPDITRNRLRVALASLRRQLEPPGVPSGAVLESVGNQQVRLRAETVTTDVAAFEAAVRSGDTRCAAALYRGPLLPAFYEDWIAPEQERLAALAAQGAGAAARAHGGVAAVPASVPTPVALPALAAPPHAPPGVFVPLYLTKFCGRDAERSQLAALFADPQARLITLTGPGGIGKTRLAAETVREDPMLRAFVPLVDLWDANQLGHALRQALHLPPSPGGDSLGQVIEQINKEPKVRLVLDNVEQIAQGAALVIGDLLARAPGLFVLVTSRRRLDFPGEREVSVAPLSLPTGDLEQIAAAPSVQLFLSRAQAVRPDCQITPRNCADFSAICHLLDGVPLALELAAARAGTLSPGQIRERLAECIDSGGNGGGETASRRRGKESKEWRHHSMNAVIGWSFALLPPDLRHFFLALSVFRGGWDIAAAEAVTGEGHALDTLSRLRGHSLVTSDGGERFRLLETLRSWADNHLDSGGGGGDDGSGGTRDLLLGRHAQYYQEAGEAAVARTRGSGEANALDTLEADRANLWAVFERAAANGDAETTLRFALILYPLGRTRGSLSETIQMLHRALAIAGSGQATDPALHARALLAVGEITLVTRGAALARDLFASALPLARQSGDAVLTARTLRSLADSALLGDDFDGALPLYTEALAVQCAQSDERGAAGTRASLALLAVRTRNDFAEAARLTREAGEYYRRVGDLRMVSYNVFNLGEIEMEQGHFAAAQPHFQESLNLAEGMGDEWQRVCALFALARTVGKRGQDREQAALMREVLPLALRVGDLVTLRDALREQAQIAKSNNDLRRAVSLQAAAHMVAQEAEPGSAEAFAETAHNSGLGEQSFRAAWERGAALSREEAVALAVGVALPGSGVP